MVGRHIKEAFRKVFIMDRNGETRVLPMLLTLLVIMALTLTSCATDGGSLQPDIPDSTYSDDTISATLQFPSGRRTVFVTITNTSDGIIEIDWPKASWKGNELIDSGDYRNPNAQLIPPSLLSPGSQVRKTLTLKSSVLFVSGKFYKHMPWVDNAKVGEFVFAYKTTDGEEHLYVL